MDLKWSTRTGLMVSRTVWITVDVILTFQFETTPPTVPGLRTMTSMGPTNMVLKLGLVAQSHTTKLLLTVVPYL